MSVTEDILYSSVRELGTILRTRRISSLELTEACLNRLEMLGPKLGAVVTVARRTALDQARAADREIRAGQYRGPLHGIPYGVKDLLATRGIPTTWGATPYENQVFDYDATPIMKLRKAGCVLVAKLAMVELAGWLGYNTADASFTGPTRSPWNTDFWSGGSSSGPAAATAAALVPFSIGSETSGSIITPSAFSGVSGLRPTYGRVSRHGAMALSWTLDKLGPMCRSADDCGLVLQAIAGRDKADPSTVAVPFSWRPAAGPRTFRVGVIKHSTDKVQPAVRKNFEESLRVLRRFATIEEAVEFPDHPFREIVGTIAEAEAASAFRDLIESGRTRELRAKVHHWEGHASSMVLAVDYLQAMRLRGVAKRIMDALYSKYDALVAPSRETVAYPIGVDFDKAYPDVGSGSLPIISAGNAVGQPAISVPNGFGTHSLPTGILFTGRAWSEARLLALAHAYQQATEWHKQRPQL